MSDDSTSLKDTVADFLRRNPGFLTENPDILQTIELAHDAGSAASLIERQVEALRDKNRELVQQLNRLVHLASENEQLMSRLHQLTLELMAIHRAPEFFDHLSTSLLEDFNADILQICLFDPAITAGSSSNVRLISRDDPELSAFEPQLQKNQTICGRLSEAKLEFLFPGKTDWVQSTALVPLGDSGSSGMLAIGSSDPAKFYPGMGTLFLDLLSDVVASSLVNMLPGERRRSA